jgi:hypothetical protein
MKKAILKE